MSEVGPWLFLTQLLNFAGSLPSPLDTIAVLLIIGVLIVFGIGVFGALATIWSAAHHIIRN
jgi:hypothetical protein